MNQRDMRAFYQRYPYPKVVQVEYDRNLHDHLRYLAHGCYDNPAPKNGTARARMLIAGCGTQEAVLWATSLPQFDVDAVDLSEASIEISKALAEQIGVSNLCFRRGDFEKGEGLEGPYDFISSYGVLHHLASPERGLEQLERVLKPGGMMALMLYNKTNRGPIQQAQRLISLLCQDQDPAVHEAAAVEICRVGASSSNHLQRVFQSSLADFAKNREHFADTLLNPREVAYTIPTLVDLLATAGLELVAPALPIAWDPVASLPAEAYARFRALPLLQRLELADSLMGPLFWVLVRRRADRGPERPCAVDADLFWDIVVMPMDTGAWPVEELIVAAEPVPFHAKMKPIQGDMVGIMRQAVHPRTFHKVAWYMVENFDGERTLREVAMAAAAQMGTKFALVEATLAGFLHRLIDEMAVGTPDVERCLRCPARAQGQCASS